MNNTAIQPLYYIASYYRRKDKTLALSDLSEIGYSTIEEANKNIAERRKDDDDFYREQCEQWSARMKAFLFDETTEDREPMMPVKDSTIYKAELYYFIPEKGYFTEEEFNNLKQ